MMVIKTWANVTFIQGKSSVEATLNYKDKSYFLTHGNNDNNVQFHSGIDEFDIELSINRAKCVTSALQYIKKELGL